MLEIQDLGLIPYPEAYARQKSSVDEVLAGGRQKLLLCEHPAVITLGRLAKPANILLAAAELGSKGVRVITIDRGGDVTLHAPGQLVVYPILDLKAHGKDLKQYLSKLEEVAIDFLTSFDILTSRFTGRTGVWCGNKKIVSLGVGVRKWVSFHGMGINLNTDLGLFQLIRPCGLDVEMASVQGLTGKPVDMVKAKDRLAETFKKHFGFE
jgi:lipoate-protein ligase B